MKHMTQRRKELWIDLHTLVESASFDTGFVCFDYDFTNHYMDESIIYNVRIALRSLGYKITKIKNHINSHYRCIFLEIFTNITKEDWEPTTPIYNDYVKDIYEDYEHECCEESESDSENEELPPDDPLPLI